jgi:hypothetical protein
LDLQGIASLIINETQFSEPVHEETDPPASCAHHLCQRFLTDLGDRNFGLSFLAKASKKEEDASQPFLAGIEKLVNQVFFMSDVPRQQVRYEHIRKCSFPMDHFHHGFLIDAHYRAIGHCGRGAHAESLSCEATFAEEFALIQNAYRGFLSGFGHNGKSYPSFLDVENCIG